MMTPRTVLWLLVAALCSTSLARAETAAPTSGFRAEFLGYLEGTEKKLFDLAGAFPAEKYSWRPAEGIRSVGESLMHIAAANYFFAGAVGASVPEGLKPQELEKSVTEKQDVIEALKKSLAHVRQAALNVSDEDGDKAVKLFGRDSTYRAVFLVMLGHISEHLGQSIAYARMNGVVPPGRLEGERAAGKLGPPVCPAAILPADPAVKRLVRQRPKHRTSRQSG